jgi:hypothetical protein
MDPRAGLPGAVGGHRQSRRCWLRQWGTVCSFGDNFAKVQGYFWPMRRMALVQEEEQRPLRSEAMKSGEPGDIQTLGKYASTWEQTVYHYYMLEGQRKLSSSLVEKKNNDSASKKGLYQMDSCGDLPYPGMEGRRNAQTTR